MSIGDDMNKLIAKIVEILLKNEAIKEDDKEIYEYGLLTMFLTVGKVLFLTPFFVLMGNLGGYVAFLLGFSYIRMYSGGLHSKSALKCTVYSFFLIVMILEISKWVYNQELMYIPLFSIFVGTIFIFKYAPGDVRNRPITDEEHIFFKRRSRVIAVVEFLIIAIITLIGKIPYEMYVFALSMLVQSINIISIRSDKNEQKIITH